MYMRRTVTDRVAWFVCQSVSTVRPAKWLNWARCSLGCGVTWPT